MSDSADDFAYLPPTLAEIARVAGLKAALALAQEQGGSKVYIPRRAPDSHWLVEIVGREAADRISELFGDQRVVIPLGPERYYARAARVAAQKLAEGKSLDAVRREVGVHVRTVSRIKARMKGGGGGDQGNLF